MDNKTTALFLAGALALTMLSACGAAIGADGRDSTANSEMSGTRSIESLSVGALRGRLRGTQAISFAGKLGLKFEIDGLLEKFRIAHESHSEMRSLRMPFDSLLARIGSLLGADPQLAVDIATSREAIWAVLIDPAKFAYLG